MSRILTFNSELSARFSIGGTEVYGTSHVHFHIVKNQNVFVAFFLNLTVLKAERGVITKSKVLWGFVYCLWCNAYSRLMQSLSFQFPVTMHILLRDLSLKSSSLGLCDLHAVQWTDNLDITLCRDKMEEDNKVKLMNNK